jgi:hypothetical protein
MNEVCFFSANLLARCKVELKDLVLSDLSRVSQSVFPELDQPRTKKGLVLPPALLEKPVRGQAVSS